MELNYFDTNDPLHLAPIRGKISEFEEEANREIKFLGKYVTARHYEEGDQPGKMLANILKPSHSSPYITEILDNDDKPIRGPKEIHDYLTEFYTSLYTSTTHQIDSEMTAYLDSLELLWLGNAHQEYLDEPFTVDDIVQVINSLPADKAPGLDGLTTAFYKCYATLLAPHLMEMYQESLQNGSLPPTTREAVILMLLKHDKPPDHCDSYTPLSLL